MPTINKELHPFSTFDFFPDRDAQVLADEGSRHGSPMRIRRSATTFSASKAKVVQALEVINMMKTQISSIEDLEAGSSVNESVTAETAVASPTTPATPATPPGPRSVDEHVTSSKPQDLIPTPSYSQVLIGPFGDWTRALSEHVQRCSEDQGSWTGEVYAAHKESELSILSQSFMLTPMCTTPAYERAYHLALSLVSLPRSFHLLLRALLSLCVRVCVIVLHTRIVHGRLLGLATRLCSRTVAFRPSHSPGEAWVQGPFTSPFSSSFGYGRVVLVVTGIGLSAALPIVQQLMCAEREVCLIWITRSKEQVSFMLPLLLNCTTTMIFYDGDESMSDVQSGLGRHKHVRIYVGRPRIDKIIGWIVIRTHALLWRKLIKEEEKKPVNQGAFAKRLPNASKKTRILPEERAEAVHLGNADERNGLTVALPHDVATFNECDASLLLKNLSAQDRSSWALLYCGNVPPVKKIVRETSERWGFLYSEESFAW